MGNREFASLADWCYELGHDQHSGASGPQLVDPDGAEASWGSARHSWDAAQVIDDGDAGFSFTGTWTTTANGYQTDSQEATGSDGSKLATWTFSGLDPAPGTRWPSPGRHRGDLSYDARSSFRDGGSAISTVSVNQQVAPADFTDGGVGWKRLGTYYLRGGSLSVQMPQLELLRLSRRRRRGAGTEDPGGSWPRRQLPRPSRLTDDRRRQPDRLLRRRTAAQRRSHQPGSHGQHGRGDDQPAQWSRCSLPTAWRSSRSARRHDPVASAGLDRAAPGAADERRGRHGRQWLADAYQTAGYSSYTSPTPSTPAASRILRPQAVYQSYIYATYWARVTSSRISCPCPMATYTIRLHLWTRASSIDGRKFDVRLQGQQCKPTTTSTPRRGAVRPPRSAFP